MADMAALILQKASIIPMAQDRPIHLTVRIIPTDKEWSYMAMETEIFQFQLK
jgi:hypothetical protein